ncbi:MAG: SUMF1/EgtB/PvdO family nonheme iron enzyme [Polyangiaceae bacterium]|nr:SUMF1/EgtB/PvdO family nonheme iron enzyme [Polyangiaceae bacterium]
MKDHNPVVLSPGGLFGGRYQIVRCIASGGMGAVYETIHLDTQRTRALKVMLPQLVSNDQLRQRFKQEATVVSKVNSQHVVEITDAGVDSATGAPFIVMEYLIGSDLQDLLKEKGPMQPHQLAELVRQAALALDRTHAHGIVHRDLKPENLFVTLRDDGTPHLKVLDFGIAKVVADGMRSTNQTATIGTPAYMAPEQIQSKTSIGPATDVYSLAQVMYTMLVGEPYFAEEQEVSENAFQLIVCVAKGVGESAKARAHRRRGVELSDAIDDWFRRATAMTPGERYPSAGALAAAFKDAVGATGDLRMSLPDAKRAESMSTAEFLAGQPAEAGGSGSRASGPTEVAGPMSFAAARKDSVPESGDTVPASTAVRGRTISASIADPVTPKKKPTRWPYFVALGAAVAAGAVITVMNLRTPPEPPPAHAASGSPTAEVKVATGAPSGSAASAPGVPTCPEGMLLVARATFPMGGNDGDAKPVHKVMVGPYCIEKTEVSVAQYKKCVDAGKCKTRTDSGGGDMVDFETKMQTPQCNYAHSDRQDHPMNCVDWADANAYCAWAGRRLPSEAEWELAARGPDGRELPWGNGNPSAKHLNACGQECRETFGKGAKEWDVLFADKDGWAGTAPIGTFPEGASAVGALDMAGNVGEWTSDWLVPYEASASVLEDPKPAPKPADNPRRVIRGGSFLSYSIERVSPSDRAAWPEDKRAATAGIRCAGDVSTK